MISGNETVALGSTRIYAPTFQRDISLKFDDYDGPIRQSEFETLALESACILISTVNSMLENYNFSMAKYGFLRF